MKSEVGEDPRRAAGAARVLGRADDQRRPGGGDGAEVGDALDPPAVRRQPGIVGGEVGREPEVERQRVHRDAGHVRLFDQHLRRLDVKAGEVHLALGVGVAELRRRHMRSPARVHRHAGARGDRAVGSDPGLEVIGGDLRIGVRRRLGADIDDAERHHEAFGRDRIHRQAVGRKVQRRIHVRAGVFVDADFLQVEAVLGEVVDLRLEELRVAEEGGEGAREGMGHVGDAAGGGAGGRRDGRDGCRGGGRPCREAEEIAPTHHPGLDAVGDAGVAHGSSPCNFVTFLRDFNALQQCGPARGRLSTPM